MPVSDAVVVGGGLAGMLAVGALLDHVDTVTVVERDRYPAEPVFRKGVPQSRHLHVFLTGGQRALESLLPGTLAELEAAGARRLEAPRDFLTRAPSGWQRRYHEGRHSMISCTRPVFDATVRARVLADAAKSRTRVAVLEGSEAVGLLGGADRVTGIRVRSRDAGRAERELPADLVVDASGRGSRAPRWLAELGRRPPREEVVDAGIAYTTQMFRPAAPLDAGIAVQARADCPRGAVWCPVEDGNWLLTLAGVRGHHPPTESAGVLDFVASLDEPHLRDHVRAAEAVAPAYGFRDTSNRRRRYEAPGGVPDGLVVVSDAACTFNPIYGQGMSVAAMSARALRDIASARDLSAPGFAAAAQAATARAGDTAWMTAVGADRPYAAADDTTPPGLPERLRTWYFNRLVARAAIDRTVGAAFRDLTFMTAGPGRLLAPSVALRTLLLPRRPGLAGPPVRPRSTVG
ncbi:NAD(P)/FAD-dependent oxidoreductase [Streptomyces sp. XD-27]|uniref:NAD(P)/FAD-dependent oxidoreductase n=1 Tax=Streptomyces sp. XD-27 TaxID=3062779 RepID=UPI0026F46764|nr:FAD-dependent monooxygenase [Streptomyces sp. XD-27]WKX68970.1 FAD-dependent monooxygenase [Streptomyces sp. XD-27]